MDADVLQADFERDGYVVVSGALDGPTVEAALEDLGRLRRELPLPAGAPIVAVQLTDGPLAALVADERLVAVASTLLESPVEAFGATYLCKPARVGLPVRWHQDGGPWAERLAGAAALTVWIALEDADAANGCLRMIPGSHRLAAQPLQPDGIGPSLFGSGMDTALVDESRAVEVPIAAGDLVVHHPNVVHGSGPNCSARPRTALAVRYRTSFGEASPRPAP